MKECGCLRVEEEEGYENIRLEGARICIRPGKIYIADGFMRGGERSEEKAEMINI